MIELSMMDADITDLRSDVQELGGAVDVLRRDLETALGLLDTVRAEKDRLERAFIVFIEKNTLGPFHAKNQAEEVLYDATG